MQTIDTTNETPGDVSRGDISRLERAAIEAAFAAGYITRAKWHRMGEPLGYFYNRQHEENGLPREWLRPIEPADFLSGFADWVSQAWCAMSQIEDNARRIRRYDRPIVEAALKAGGDAFSDAEVGAAFVRWAESVLWMDNTQAERDELYNLRADAAASADECGDFDFHSEATRKYFERFLDEKNKRREWDNSGFTYDDLIAVADSEAREAA